MRAQLFQGDVEMAQNSYTQGTLPLQYTKLPINGAVRHIVEYAAKKGNSIPSQIIEAACSELSFSAVFTCRSKELYTSRKETPSWLVYHIANKYGWDSEKIPYIGTAGLCECGYPLTSSVHFGTNGEKFCQLSCTREQKVLAVTCQYPLFDGP